MSTTEQQQQGTLDPVPTSNPSTSPSAPPAEPAAAAEPKSSTREYTLFEEARTDTWTQIGVAVAGTPEDAIDTLGEQKIAAAQKEQKRFMAVPSRFAVPKKPKVKTVTTIEYE